MSRWNLMIVSLLILVLSAANVFALSKSLDELLSEEEIIMPDNLEERYPDASAVIILDKEEIDQSRSINPVYIDYHVAVKIMNDEGVREFSTIKIPYYEQVKVNDMNAQIIRGGQIIKINDIGNRDVDLEGVDNDFVFPIAMGSNVFFLRPAVACKKSWNSRWLVKDSSRKCPPGIAADPADPYR